MVYTKKSPRAEKIRDGVYTAGHSSGDYTGSAYIVDFHGNVFFQEKPMSELLLVENMPIEKLTSDYTFARNLTDNELFAMRDIVQKWIKGEFFEMKKSDGNAFYFGVASKFKDGGAMLSASRNNPPKDSELDAYSFPQLCKMAGIDFKDALANEFTKHDLARLIRGGHAKGGAMPVFAFEFKGEKYFTLGADDGEKPHYSQHEINLLKQGYVLEGEYNAARKTHAQVLPFLNEIKVKYPLSELIESHSPEYVGFWRIWVLKLGPVATASKFVELATGGAMDSLLDKIKSDLESFRPQGHRGDIEIFRKYPVNETEQFTEYTAVTSEFRHLGHWIDDEESAHEFEDPESDRFDEGWREDNDQRVWAPGEYKRFKAMFTDWAKGYPWFDKVTLDLETSEKDYCEFIVKIKKSEIKPAADKKFERDIQVLAEQLESLTLAVKYLKGADKKAVNANIVIVRSALAAIKDLHKETRLKELNTELSDLERSYGAYPDGHRNSHAAIAVKVDIEKVRKEIKQVESGHDIDLFFRPIKYAKGGEISGVTTVNYEDGDKTLLYGSKNNQTRISVKGMSPEDIKEEYEFEKMMLQQSIDGLPQMKAGAQAIQNLLHATLKEKKEALDDVKRTEKNIEVVKKIVIPFYEKHLAVPDHYIEYLDKDNSFRETRKEFTSFEEARDWGRKNLGNFNIDMIRMIRATGGGISKYATGGEILKHKSIPTLTIELLEQTNKGWKVKETDTKGIGKVRQGKTAFYSDAEIKSLFTAPEKKEFAQKTVFLKGDDTPYIVISDKGDKYIVVIQEKMELWNKATPLERAEYYEEWIPKSEMTE